MNIAIQQLIEVSRFYGKNKDFVIAGGGNTSYRTKNLHGLRPAEQHWPTSLKMDLLFSNGRD